MRRGKRSEATTASVCADEADARRGPIARTTALVLPVVERVMRLRPVRVFTHLSDRGGALLAAGMSYQALFAVFAAVWVLFSVAGLWLRSDPQFTEALIQTINGAVPGLIGSNGASGAIDPRTLLSGGPLSWTGLIALVGLFWTAVGWMAAARQAVRGIFDLPRDPRNVFLQKAGDLVLALIFGVLLIASAALTVASSSALGSVFSLVGVGTDSVVAVVTARLTGFLIAVALNALTLGIMFRVLSRVRIPWRNLALGTLLAAVALVAMSSLSGLLLGGAGRNPLLASFVVFVGLLIWFNLICRVILLAASWIAVGMADAGISPGAPETAPPAGSPRRRWHSLN